MLQLSAILQKNYIEKRRNIRVSCCECCSHLVIVLILVLGFRMSKVLRYPSSQYDVVQLRVPPSSLESLQDSNNFKISGVQSDIQTLLNGPLIIPSFDTYVTAAKFVTSNYRG